MPAAAIAAVGSIAGGLMAQSGAESQADAAREAANKSAEATRYGIDVQKQIYDQNRADQTPWRDTGSRALNQLNAGMFGSPLTSRAARLQLNNQLWDKSQANGMPASSYYQPNVFSAQNNSGPFGVPVATSANPQQLNQLTRPKTRAELDNDPGPLFNGQLAALLASPQNSVPQGDSSSMSFKVARAVEELAGRNYGQPLNSAAYDESDGYTADSAPLSRAFGMSDYQEDPGYQFRLSEGLKQLQNSAAARGGLLSGSALKGITRYGQDAASQEYQNAFNRFQSNQANQFNRLADLAGIGQTANNALASFSSNYGNNVGNLAMINGANQGNAALAGGNARASAYQGIGNALGRTDWSQMGSWFNGGGGGGIGMGSTGQGLGQFNVEGYGGGGV